MIVNEPLFGLDNTWSELALGLFAAGTVGGTLQQIVELAVVAIEGCDVAGIFELENGKVVTTAYSDRLVVELDGMQFETGEGPCLDAVKDGGTYYAEDLSDDVRWPIFGQKAATVHIRSLLAFPLSADRPGALNLYATLPLAFGAVDRAKGLIFATLAGIALGAAKDRESEDQKFDNLHDALKSREMIGQAQGILMERERITAHQAFDVLRRASQHLNRKLRQVAEEVVVTGEIPPEG